MTEPVLAGRRALVTGGASGIGRAIAACFVEAGARVAIIDISGKAAAATAGELGGEPKVIARKADVTDSVALGAAIDAAAADLGGLDLVVANAGTGNVMPFERYDDAEWDRLLNTNLRGAFATIRAAVPHLRRAADDGAQPAVVTVGSVSGVRATRGEAPYAAAKAGLVAITQAAALELAPTIRVNCVSPGFVATPLTEMALADESLRAAVIAGTPLGRIATPEEIAEVVLFLAGAQSRFITGQNLIVDGGTTLTNASADPLLHAVLGFYD